MIYNPLDTFYKNTVGAVISNSEIKIRVKGNFNSVVFVLNKDGESELGNYESNLRISRYDTDDLTNSTAPYTRSYNTGGKFKTITDDTKASLGQG